MSDNWSHEICDDIDDEPVERTLPPLSFGNQAAWDGLLVLMVALFHANGVYGVFVFDDFGAIVNNASIQDPWNWLQILFGATQATVVDRPVLNISLAINRAWGGTDPFGYHVVNILIHAINAVLVARLARVLFTAEGAPHWLRDRAVMWGAFAGGLWSLHPLTTAAVVYVVQRAEMLMALFFLMALLSLERSTRSPRSALWRAGSIAAFLLCLATKEVAVAFPPLALAFDRWFLARDWRAVCKRRGGYHMGTFCLAFLYAVRTLFFSSGRDRTAGLETPVTAGEYLTTQFVVVTDYLWLVLCPVGQAFDWGLVTITDPWRYGPRLAILLGLAGLTVRGTLRRQRWAFAGWWFFFVLGPTSSVIPLATQVAAEHRMYLALAAPVLLAVVGLKLLAARWSSRGVIAVACVVLVVLGALTIRRNALFASPLALWVDCATHRPENPRAYNNVVGLLRNEKRYEEALVWANRALEIPSVKATTSRRLNSSRAYPSWLTDRGWLYWQLGRTEQALADFDAALTADPRLSIARLNRILLLMELNRFEDAIVDCDALIAERQRLPEALGLRGEASLRLGRLAEAEAAAQALESLTGALPEDFRRKLEAARAQR
jgi:protein O-mannosyl-transferase